MIVTGAVSQFGMPRPATTGPVANAQLHCGAGDAEDVPADDSLRWYSENAEKREALAEEARVEAGDAPFNVGQSLRLTWLHCQRLDKTLRPMFGAKELAKGYRKAEDGLLERSTSSPVPPGERWVPIVPDGMATAHLTWKRWMFLQCHVGVLGAHRSAESAGHCHAASVVADR